VVLEHEPVHSAITSAFPALLGIPVVVVTFKIPVERLPMKKALDRPESEVPFTQNPFASETFAEPSTEVPAMVIGAAHFVAVAAFPVVLAALLGISAETSARNVGIAEPPDVGPANTAFAFCVVRVMASMNGLPTVPDPDCVVVSMDG
jgi:hypothetical protein